MKRSVKKIAGLGGGYRRTIDEKGYYLYRSKRLFRLDGMWHVLCKGGASTVACGMCLYKGVALLRWHVACVVLRY